MEYFKHTIMDALNHSGCPICHIIKQREEKALWWFFTENYHDGQVLEDLIDNSFLCDDHAKMLENEDHASLSFCFQVMVLSDIEKLNRAEQFLKISKEPGALLDYFRRNKKSEHEKIVTEIFRGYTSCRFCRMNENTSRYVEGVFAELLQEDTAFRDLYVKSSGLCRKHFIEVLKLCNDNASWGFLLSDTISRLNKMLNRFELYFHKLDYRFSHEQKGDEQNAWLDAMNYFSSSKRDGGKPSET